MMQLSRRGLLGGGMAGLGGAMLARPAAAGMLGHGLHDHAHGCSICSELRSEEHTSELQSLMRISYAVFCLKKKRNIDNINKKNNLHIYINHHQIKTKKKQ